MFRLKKIYNLIGIFILIVIFTKIDFQEVIFYFSKIDLKFFFLINLLIIPTIFFKSYRWKKILRLQGIDYSTKDSFISYLSGIYVGLVTPGRIGEAIKVFYLKSDRNIPVSEGMASVIVDRLLDLYLLFLIGGIGFFSLSSSREGMQRAIILIFLFTALTVPFILLNKPIAEKIARPLYRMALSKINEMPLEIQFKNFVGGMKKALSWPIYPAVALTFFSHLCYFLMCYLLARLIHIDISFIAVTLFVSISALISLLPITIWGIGTREASLVYLFLRIKLTAESAIAYAFLLFISLYLVGGVMSFFGWALRGISQKDGRTVYQK